MNRLHLIVPACLLIVLGIIAASLGLADVYRNEATVFVGQWEAEAFETGGDTIEPPAWVWEQQYRYLWLASLLAPFDPQIKIELGKLYEQRADSIWRVQDDPGEDYSKALSYYRESVLLQPTWPYVWSDYSLLKITQGQIDTEFAYAMQRAITLGPWQAVVQASVAAGGVLAWDDLPVELQLQIEDVIAKGLQNKAGLMHTLAEQFNLYEEKYDMDVDNGSVSP